VIQPKRVPPTVRLFAKKSQLSNIYQHVYTTLREGIGWCHPGSVKTTSQKNYFTKRKRFKQIKSTINLSTTPTIMSQSSSSSSSDFAATWQQCQSKFRPSKDSLMSCEDNIDSAIEQHFQLPCSPSSSSEVPPMFPTWSFYGSIEADTSAMVPMTTLRRDHSEDGSILQRAGSFKSIL